MGLRKRKNQKERKSLEVENRGTVAREDSKLAEKLNFRPFCENDEISDEE